MACGDAGERREGELRAGRHAVTPVLPSQPSRRVWSLLSPTGALGEDGWGPQGVEGEGIPAGSGWVSLGTWRVGTEINEWRFCEDRPVTGFMAAFRENPGFDVPFLWEDGSS